MIQTLFIPYIGQSTNKIYAGIHFRERLKDAELGHFITLLAVGIYQTNPCAGRVKLVFTPYHNGRPRDCSNYCYAAKIIEDGLIKAGIISNDDDTIVRQIVINSRQFSSDLGNGFKVDILPHKAHIPIYNPGDDIIKQLQSIGMQYGKKVRRRRKKPARQKLKLRDVLFA